MPCLGDSTHFVEVFEVKKQTNSEVYTCQVAQGPGCWVFEEVDCEVQFGDKN